MKITKAEAAFRPVTIVLETATEVEAILYAITRVASCPTGFNSTLCDLHSKLKESLS